MVLGDEVSWTELRGDGGAAGRAERRRYRRFRLELSVNVHLGGRPEPVTVEIVDIAVRGVRFRSPAGAFNDGSRGSSDSAGGGGGAGAVSRVRLLDEASFGFVSREQHICVAHGRVLRVAAPRDAEAAADAASPPASAPSEVAPEVAPEVSTPEVRSLGDEFVVSVERANAAFHSFLASLAA